MAAKAQHTRDKGRFKTDVRASCVQSEARPKSAVTRPYSFSRASKQLLVEIKVTFLARKLMKVLTILPEREDRKMHTGEWSRCGCCQDTCY